MTVEFVWKGGKTPTMFPHFCPVRLKGASPEECKQITTNYQQNLRNCCGTKDGRNILPCNSMHRRCIACLEDGRGVNASTVAPEDVLMHRCKEHLEARAPAKKYVPPSSRPSFQRPPVGRVTVESDLLVAKARPVFARTLEPEIAKASPPVILRPNKPFEPPPKPKPLEPPAPVVEDPVTIISVPPDSALAQLVDRPEEPAEPAAAVLPEKPPYVPATLTAEQIDEMARMVPDFSPRELEVCLCLVTKSIETAADDLTMRLQGVVNYMNMACRWWGLPKDKPLQPFDRLGALRSIMQRYIELKAEGAFEEPEPVPAEAPLPAEEEELLQHFRRQTKGIRDSILALVRNLR